MKSLSSDNSTLNFHSSLLFVPSERIEGLVYQPATHFLFLLRGNARIPHHVNDAVSQDETVRADHFGNRQSRGDLNGWDPCLL